MDQIRLKKLYGRLKGLRELTFTQHYMQSTVVDDYNKLVGEISKIVDEDMSSFLLQQYRKFNDGKQVEASDVQSKLLQLLSYLEYGFNLSESVIEIGSI